MTILYFVLWFGVAAVLFAALSAAQYPIRKHRDIPLRVVVIIAKLLLGAAAAYFIMAVDLPFAYHAGFVLAALYAVLLADAAGDILTLPYLIIKRKSKQNRNRMQIIVCAACAVVFIIFGTVNMQTVTANRFNYTSDKLTNTYRFVFISDLHAGSSQSMDTVGSTIRGIADENADFVLLGGDIVDEYTTKEEMKYVFSLFKEIKAPVYFIYGNHDRQPAGNLIGERTFSDKELEDTILSNGITILKDEWIPISDELVLFGRESYDCVERKALSAIPARPDNAFVLQADHSPYLYDDITESGADLQMSGHTHAGQLFPLRLIYGLAGYDAYGFFRHGNTDVYISSGAGGWRFPVRTEAGCRYEVVTLQPEQ